MFQVNLTCPPKNRTKRYESPTGHTGQEDEDEGQASPPQQILEKLRKVEAEQS
jgi:hypothetical protein